MEADNGDKRKRRISQFSGFLRKIANIRNLFYDKVDDYIDDNEIKERFITLFNLKKPRCRAFLFRFVFEWLEQGGQPQAFR